MSDKEDVQQSSRPLSGENEVDKQPPITSLKAATHKLKTEALRRLQLEGGDLEEEAPERATGSHENEGKVSSRGADESEAMKADGTIALDSASSEKDTSNASNAYNENTAGSPASRGDSHIPRAAESSEEAGTSSTAGVQEEGDGEKTEGKDSTAGPNTSAKNEDAASRSVSGSRPGSGKHVSADRKSSSRPASGEKCSGGSSRPSSGHDRTDKEFGKGALDLSSQEGPGGASGGANAEQKDSMVGGEVIEPAKNGKDSQDVSSGENKASSKITQSSKAGDIADAIVVSTDIGANTVEKDSGAVMSDNGKPVDGGPGATTGETHTASSIDDNAGAQTDVNKNAAHVLEQKMNPAHENSKSPSGSNRPQSSGEDGKSGSGTADEAGISKSHEGVAQQGEEVKGKSGETSAQDDETKHTDKQSAGLKNEENVSDEVSPPVDVKAEGSDDVERKGPSSGDQDGAGKADASVVKTAKENEPPQNSEVDSLSTNEKKGETND